MTRSILHLLSLGCLAASSTSCFALEAATPVDMIHAPEGFQVELLYSVPKDDQGSWVAMCFDDKNRILVSDQYGFLYRVTPPALDSSGETKVEKIDLEIGAAQGLAFIDGSIYLQVNGNEFQGRGLYQVEDTDKDDTFDKVTLLRGYTERSGEHGPHAVVPAPDGKSLYVVVGNQTPIPDIDLSRVPEVWQEDILQPRIVGRGFMRDAMAPRGWVAKVSLDGKHWELLTTGFRNQYDAAFNHEGDLFTYDADMEWDMNTPWYRPTRVCQVLSGSDYGWRNGSAKWPVRWEDGAPPIVDVGPGSPTGVSFGYGAKFPAKYQEAFYVADWSYGKLYAVHLTPQGAGYAGEVEEFISAQPLPLTDLAVNPADGAMYFTIGGRRTQSGLYRVTYTGSESTEPNPMKLEGKPAELHALRRSLEAHHGKPGAEGLDLAWANLGHPDRLIRNAARIVVESNPVDQWRDRALAESDTRAALTAHMALIRCSKPDARDTVLAKLAGISTEGLSVSNTITLARNYALAYARLGQATGAQLAEAVAKFGPLFPHKNVGLSIDLCDLLVFCGDESVVAKTVPLLDSAPTQEEQIAYAKALRLARSGWTPELRESYFKWFLKAANYTGGASFGLFIEDIKKDAIAGLSADEKKELEPILNAKPEPKAPTYAAKALTFHKAWTMPDLDSWLGAGLEGGRDFENGRNSFGAVGCFACHRFNMEGGAVGPDLTSVSGKFGPRDLLESIIDPNKEISDQYGSLVFTLKDGSTVMGRIVNMKEDTVQVNTNMMDPNALQGINRPDIVKMEESKVSMMPPGLLNMLSEEDILDLLAYLLSKGDPEDPMFGTK